MFSNGIQVKSLNVKVALGFGIAVAVSVFAARLLQRSRKRKLTRIIETFEELRNPSVKIKDPELFEAKLCQLISGGADRLQVIMDFDHTITRIHFNGQPCSTTYTILDTSPLIPLECRETAKVLTSKYYPIEFDPALSIEEKIPHMLEWYTKSHEVLIKSGISKSDLGKMVEMSTAMLRDGCPSLFRTLNEHGVPLLIFSAGCGDVLEEVLKHFSCIYPNMKFVSNYIDFDDKGIICGFKGNLIHMFNKNQSSLHNSDYFQRLESRSNVLLVGDSLGDLDMSKGAQGTDVTLRVGFLNKKIDEYLPQYMDAFDIVLMDDQSMDVLNGLLGRIL